MKIVLASTSFKGGGISSYAHEVINNFSEGNEFHVIVGDEYDMPIINRSVIVHHLECEDLTIKNLKTIHKLINEEIRPNLILSNNAAAISILAPYINDNIRIITLSHSLKYIEADKSSFTHKYVDKIIAASSQYNKEYLIKKFKIRDSIKVEVIYNFVVEYEKADEIRKRKQQQDNDICILFPGGGYPSKAPDVVLQIVKKLLKTDLHFKFYWTGNTHIFLSNQFPFFGIKKIQDLLPKDDRLIFPGRLPRREDVAELYANANIFLTPSRREGCPISLIEAMRVGAICIVADFENGNKEIIKDGVNGFEIHHEDIDGYVELISDVIRNNNKYAHIYDKSFATFREELSYPVWKKNMERIISDINLNHKKRHKSVSLLGLRLTIIRFRLLEICSDICRTIEESLLVFIKLLKSK